MRVGQKNKLTYRWARTGSRPRAVHDQRTQSTYLFGAVCPEHGKGSGLVLPVCNAEAMQLHLDDIAAKVAPRAHATFRPRLRQRGLSRRLPHVERRKRDTQSWNSAMSCLRTWPEPSGGCTIVRSMSFSQLSPARPGDAVGRHRRLSRSRPS